MFRALYILIFDQLGRAATKPDEVSSSGFNGRNNFHQNKPFDNLWPTVANILVGYMASANANLLLCYRLFIVFYHLVIQKKEIENCKVQTTLATS